MTRKELAARAFSECCSEETAVRHGQTGGFPFWNAESLQFMYAPAFHFTAIRMKPRYRYDAVDELGVTHSFTADGCCARLTPIWAELPEGVVRLTVTALNDDGSDFAPVGARTFMRLASFPEVTPPAVRSYKASALMGYRYAMQQPFVRHWLTEGTPDPRYDLNVYPSKMIGSLVPAMVRYASLCPEEAETALTVATHAADYLISITPQGDAPMAHIPPTYYHDFCPDPDEYGIRTPNWESSKNHLGQVMMLYPSRVASAYLALEKVTGDRKYGDEALKIGAYYLKTQEECGSWLLVHDMATGLPLAKNYATPLGDITPMLTALYEKTGDTVWRDAAERSVKYVEKTQLATYNWEGQFEDTVLTAHYTNLTHYGPGYLLRYYAAYCTDDAEKMAVAKELMRFIEDQFVVWKKAAPWLQPVSGWEDPCDPAIWHTPCGLEQYYWHVPIDASTADIAQNFLAMYKACGDELYLAKARALTDQLTVMQHENGQIPTHWMNTPGAERNFWFNCMFHSCEVLGLMSDYE